MELQDLLETVSGICSTHKQIKFVDYGEEFLADTIKEGKQNSIAFIELPYSIDYDLLKKHKNVKFALLILLHSDFDNVVTDHQKISLAETIGESILTKLKDQQLTLGFAITSINGLSLREFTDERYSGMRFEITGKCNTTYCNKSYDVEFN